ncbi:MAG TPA: 4-alpha-glucanotransferase [Candidatus Olsenella pullistercoris]|uniref:4-alpha-glucanotransferase n=1 Tax=Candidatus Olsenella pullistercoris TaxID=2838712 RepID=A0A9D2JEJ2_9ACTN|nr:4-alpha-glucanotransferase [Candidatus Olsenella pullistercoris]
MKARHVTSEREYRSPFGAVQLGGTVSLSIDVWDAEVVFCTLRVWTDAHGEELIEMRGSERGDVIRFTATYRPAETGVVWYSFDIEASDGAVWRYGAREGWVTGEGAFAYGDPPSFQITVFSPRPRQPRWYREGIVYQIFPDRFARGEDWEERAAEALAVQRKGGPERALVEDWDTLPTYERTPDGGVARWDFYGGTLEGIREKLGYLEDLGVTALYLNPVFEAASNHRYDTADYLRIDPMLGDEESFRALCVDAAEHGISVILDGVFNHVGADSRYFNRFGTYREPGAWQGEQSPYRDWFTFNEDGTYAGWWGDQNLPSVRSGCEGFHELVCGRAGVIRRWLRSGARGWRLDVADELTDEFIEGIKRALLAEKPDGVLIGEVWEDASHKLAYGKLRQYFQGRELDATMNYPFRNSVLAYLCGSMGASELAARLEELRENYPRDNFYSALNLLGSHDRERLFTVLGGAPNPDELNEEERATYRLSDDQVGLAKARLWVAALLQMTLPGVPCVYYGDERGVQGFRDPFNRASFPWGGGETDCTAIYRNAIALRKTLPVLVDGEFEPFSSGEDVFGFWRRGGAPDGSGDVCVLVNASLENAHTVKVPVGGREVSDVVSGQAPRVSHGQAEVFLWPLGTAVLHFHGTLRLQAPLERGMGVLCHVTSIPNGGWPGTLGAPARRFVDWLAAGGQRYWQVLPVNPPDRWGSPYAGLSAFAGNLGLLELPAPAALASLERIGNDPDYLRFCTENDYWLTPYATFRAAKELLGEKPWQEWPEPYRTYSPRLASDPRLRHAIEAHRRLQYKFQLEWDELLDYAHERGIKIIGDMPMFVSADSADVWGEPDIFDLDEKGYPRREAGAPGDAFAPDGQNWGNPCFRWDILREQGFGWWMRRFSRALALYDVVRLDHFIGFSSYFGIAAGGTARDGAYAFGPGLELFEAARRQFGPLPFIAEDLGAITPAVRALVSATGFPGMDVAQFSDSDVREGYVPRPETVAYTGTHDNQTLVGFCEGRYGLEREEAVEVARGIMGRVLASDANVAIVPLQDVLGLGDEARMNVPGVADGNWSWRAETDDVVAAAGRLADLAERSGRVLG